MIPHSQVQDAFGNQTYVTPMTRTVADTALMMQAMAGEDASDPWSIGLAPQDFVAGAAPRDLDRDQCTPNAPMIAPMTTSTTSQ